MVLSRVLLVSHLLYHECPLGQFQDIAHCLDMESTEQVIVELKLPREKPFFGSICLKQHTLGGSPSHPMTIKSINFHDVTAVFCVHQRNITSKEEGKNLRNQIGFLLKC
jgi:hypothetical protein